MSDKKKIIILCSLAALLAVLVIGYFALGALGKNNTESGDDGNKVSQGETLSVVERNSEQAIKLSYTLNGCSFTFEKNSGGLWELESDKVFPLDSTAVGTIVNSISKLSAIRTVNGGDISEYGFDKPELTVRAEYSSGAPVTLSVGKTSPYGGAYLKCGDNDTVYLVDESFKNSFKDSLDEIIEIDKMPDIDTDFLVSFTVCDENGNKNTVTDEFGLLDAADDFLSLKFVSEGSSYTNKEGLEGYGITENSPYAILAYKEEAKAQNGDGTESTVRADASYKLIFGNRYTTTKAVRDENGETTVMEVVMYYYTTEGSTIVYSVNEETYKELMEYVSYTPGTESEQ